MNLIIFTRGYYFFRVFEIKNSTSDIIFNYYLVQELELNVEF